jgi:hypothetical protein
MLQLSADRHPVDCTGCIPPPIKRWISQRKERKKNEKLNKDIAFSNQGLETLQAKKDFLDDKCKKIEEQIVDMDPANQVAIRKVYTRLRIVQKQSNGYQNMIDSIDSQMLQLTTLNDNEECLKLVDRISKTVSTAVKPMNSQQVETIIETVSENTIEFKENNDRMNELHEGVAGPVDEEEEDEAFEIYMKNLQEKKAMVIEEKILSAASGPMKLTTGESKREVNPPVVRIEKHKEIVW